MPELDHDAPTARVNSVGNVAPARCLRLGAVFSIYGFMAEYLKQVTHMGPQLISAMLLLFGGAGVAGTLVAGRLMSRDISRTLNGFLLTFTPILILLYLVGQSVEATVAVIVIWGFVHAAAVPLCQAIVQRAGPEAPEFANSLFNSLGNVGITCGTAIGGAAIARFGIAHLPIASVALLAIAAVIFGIERRSASQAYLPAQKSRG